MIRDIINLILCLFFICNCMWFYEVFLFRYRYILLNSRILILFEMSWPIEILFSSKESATAQGSAYFFKSLVQVIKSGSKTPGSSYQVIKSSETRPVQVIKLSFFTKINLIQDQVIKLFDLGFNLGSSYHLILVQVIKLSKVISHSIF